MSGRIFMMSDEHKRILMAECEKIAKLCAADHVAAINDMDDKLFLYMLADISSVAQDDDESIDRFFDSPGVKKLMFKFGAARICECACERFKRELDNG